MSDRRNQGIASFIAIVCLSFSSFGNCDSQKSGFFFNDESNLVEEGRKQYSDLVNKADIYGECWIKAVQALDTGCKQLTEDVQWRLALKFSNCFLDKSGKQTYECDDKTAIKDCIRGIDDSSYGVLSLYFTHTQSVCFFLANKIWQQSAKQTISRLTETVSNVGSQMQDLENLQRTSLSNQEQLNNEIIESKKVIEEFKETVNEQRFLENQILDRFLEVRDFLLKETSKVYTVLFYITAVFTAFLVTTPTRTNDARLALLLLCIFNFIIEVMISNHYSSDEFVNMNTVSLLIDQRIWLCRKTSCLIAIIYLVYMFFTFKDYTKMNNKLLRQIAEQNKAISIQNNELMKRIDWNRNTNVPKELEWLTDEEYIPNESSESSEDTGVESDESLSTIDLCTSPESPQSQTNLPYNFRPRKSIANKEPNETLEQFVSYFKRSKSKSKLKNKSNFD